MPSNIRFDELLGSDAKNFNYGVSSNWRLDIRNCKGLLDLLGEGSGSVASQMEFACHSDFSFTTNIVYATTSIKGIPIRQAGWQNREISSLTLSVYESMDHRLYKALVNAANRTAGYLKGRDVANKSVYTFSGIRLCALGNVDNPDSNTTPDTQATYELIGVQINSCKSPTYTSGQANISDVTLDLYAHGWKLLETDD